MKNLCFILCAFAAVPAAWADAPSLRQRMYEIDKSAVQNEFGAAQKSACVEAFHERYRNIFRMDGKLAFNDRLSEKVYDRLLWNGSGSMRRGLAFTAPVSDKDRRSTLVCYYAIIDDRLMFQDAFVLPIDGPHLANNDITNK